MKTAAIIGAGCSGLAAAHMLRDAGFAVTVFEQGFQPGGRATSNRREGLIYDPGAQYIKGSSSIVNALLTERFQVDGLLAIGKPVWVFDCEGHIEEGDPAQNAEPKWTYANGLVSLAERMAEDLDVRLQTGIKAIQLLPSGAGWRLFDKRERTLGDFERLAIALPAEEATTLLEQSLLPMEVRTKLLAFLDKGRYNPLISVTLGYTPRPRPRPYYALVNTDKAHEISWLAWEHEKARERAPTYMGLLIAQMAPSYSRQWWQALYQEIINDVKMRLTTLIDEDCSKPVFADVEFWRYALPVEKVDGEGLNNLAIPLGLAFCGDAFVGGRVHLALEHGLTFGSRLSQ